MVNLTDHYIYWEFHESIAYGGINMSGLPPTLAVEGNKLFRKSEFHITFVNLEDIAKIINEKNPKRIEREILDEATRFLKANEPSEFRLTNQFRFVQRDVRKTVVVMCKLPGADKFFSMLSAKYKKELPLQPFHITLYATPKDRGIGLLSQEDLERDTKPVELPELKDIKAAKR